MARTTMELHMQKKILSLLDVVGSTIVDIFYNHMYDRAIVLKEKTEQNITACYCSAITDYVKTKDTPEFYKTLINSIHYYTRVSTSYTQLSFVDCINLYASLFIPDVYIRSLTEKQKHDVLSMVLRETVKSFADKLLADYLALIIDEHQDPSNISLLQDCVLKELIQHRDSSYKRFVACEQDKPKRAGVRIKSTVNSTSKAVKTQKMLSKLNSLYRQAVEDRTKLKTKNEDLQTKYKALADQFKEMQTMMLNQIKLYRMQEDELMSLKQSSAAAKETKPIANTIADASVDNQDYGGLFSVQYVSDP